MSAPVPTVRLIIVCGEASTAKVNATLNTIDPSSTGDVMVATLSLPSTPSVVAGRWCSWAMSDTTKSDIVKAFGSQGWRPLTGSESKILEVADPVPAWGSQRFWSWNGDTVPPQHVLDSLGLVPTRLSV